MPATAVRSSCPLQLCNLLAEGLVLRRGLLEQGSLHLSVRLSLLLGYPCDGRPLLGVDLFQRTPLLLHLSLLPLQRRRLNLGFIFQTFTSCDGRCGLLGGFLY